jgi:hypothetical protein
MRMDDALRRLADEQTAMLEAYLAAHPGPPPEVLEELARQAERAAELLLADTPPPP